MMFQSDGLIKLWRANQDARSDEAPFEQGDKTASYWPAITGGAQQAWESLRMKALGVCVYGGDCFLLLPL